MPMEDDFEPEDVENNVMESLFDSLFTLLPKFSRNSKENFSKFIHDFEKITSAMGLQSAVRSRLLPICLNGFAETEFSSFPKQIQDSYEQSIAQLKTKFIRPAVLQRCANELFNCRQYPNESVFEFASSLKELSCSAFPDSN